ncbi:DNA internalization-related competence protein ComEC/Rec2 [Mizugakiibacter sediminis]|uniref:DNA internalization-related competence protein ComEC/Rec2 n=1 Tax=Mizugakiibacter sediminis TaxID=1475481 RepID=A0A0K8QR03_9GAMM|nr:DNA internalization-related competence protein ComEC/Rec2 [Mizugakiibacter sediminis]GAP67305.1 DNA internalization-related competence protein ComEC/Rec2 [Mizugakiibacter sediminis]
MTAPGQGRPSSHAPPGGLAAGVALLAGVLAVQALPALPPRAVDVIAILLAPLLAWRRPRLLWPAIVVAGFGWAALRADLALDARLPRALEGRDVDVIGAIDDLPRAGAHETRFELRVTSAALDGAPLPLRGLVRLAWYGGAPALAPCERWALRVRLKRPRGLIDPGGFDGERHALERGIVAVGYVRDDGAHRRLGESPCVDRLRARLAAAIAAALPEDAPTARLLQALAVGDQRGLDDADWSVLRATGTGHLIAISGLHVGLAGVLAAWLVRGLWRLWPALGERLPRPRAEAPAALLAACAYGALAGLGLPTLRTLLMIGVVALARLSRRAPGAAHTLGLALAAILLADPLAVLSAGFWLSFVGVAFLVLVIGRAPRGWRGLVHELGAAQGVMAVALLPLGVWFFGQSSLVGPLANLVAMPFVSFVIVPLTLLATALLLPLPALGVPLLHLAAALLRAQWWLLERMAAWPCAHGYFPEPGLAAFALASLGALWLLLPRGMPARALGALLFLPLLWPRAALPPPGGFEAVVLDVGQGLSVLVRTRGHALLFDAGARYASGFDLGAAVAVPALHALGVRGLDALVVSHGDNDHAGGAPAVAAAFPQARLLGGEPARGVLPLAPCRAGQAWTWDGVRFRMLYPREPGTRTGNDGACVLLVEGGGGRLLLPSDVDASVEPGIAAAVGDGPPLVLVVPHHGSRSSSSAPFLAALRPAWAIVSAGWRNRFGHPHPEVSARYAAAGVPLLDTAWAGAVRVRFPADAPPRPPESWRAQSRRYWRE